MSRYRYRNILLFRVRMFGPDNSTGTLGGHCLPCSSMEVRIRALHCLIARQNTALMLAFAVIPFPNLQERWPGNFSAVSTLLPFRGDNILLPERIWPLFARSMMSSSLPWTLHTAAAFLISSTQDKSGRPDYRRPDQRPANARVTKFYNVDSHEYNGQVT
jgi:hypothetical protein